MGYDKTMRIGALSFLFLFFALSFRSPSLPREFLVRRCECPNCETEKKRKLGERYILHSARAPLCDLSCVCVRKGKKKSHKGHVKGDDDAKGNALPLVRLFFENAENGRDCPKEMCNEEKRDSLWQYASCS